MSQEYAEYISKWQNHDSSCEIHVLQHFLFLTFYPTQR